MRIIIKKIGKVKISADFKAKIEKKFLKYRFLVKEPAVCEISLIEEKKSDSGKKKLVRVILSMSNLKKPIYVEEGSMDFSVSIDLAQESLGLQLKKYKEKKKIKTRFPIKYWTERMLEAGIAGPKWLIKKIRKGK